MKRYLIGLTLFVSIGLAFNISAFTYASSFAREESATSYGYSKIDSNVVLRQILDLKNIIATFFILLETHRLMCMVLMERLS